MRRIKNVNTEPELVVRRLLWSMGYRYRLQCKDLPGKPDIAFLGRKKAIFVHGCFWHQHGEGCSDSHIPKSNQEYWLPKFQRNQARDTAVQAALAAAGWDVMIVWECETSREDLAKRLKTFMQ